MKLGNLRPQTLQIIGKLLAAEQDDDFFKDTIAELLMKIKLTYGDLAALEASSHKLRVLDETKRKTEDQLRQVAREYKNKGLDAGERSEFNLAVKAQEVEYLDELYREQQTETRRAERKIEDQIEQRQQERER